MTFDYLGNIIVTGYNTVTAFNTDYLIVKFDTNGNLIWIRTYNKLRSDISYSVKCDRNNNIYVTGRAYETRQVPPYYFTNESYSVTIKYNSAGNIKWVSNNGMSCFNCGSENGAYALSLDNNSNVFIAGENVGKYKTIKYDSLGNMLWIKNSQNSVYGAKATNIFIDGQNKIYVSGLFQSSQYNNDILTIGYNNITGDQEWLVTYNGLENRDDILSKMIVDSTGNIYLAGYSNSNATGNDILILKYSDNSVGINSNQEYISKDFSLSQNYPNPFNPKTIINYSIPTTQYTILKVFDALGKEVATLVNEKQNAGTYSVEFDGSNFSSAIYFYKLETENFSETKRMILLK